MLFSFSSLASSAPIALEMLTDLGWLLTNSKACTLFYQETKELGDNWELLPNHGGYELSVIALRSPTMAACVQSDHATIRLYF